MKKILAMLMACVMIFSLLPVTTFAAEEVNACPGEGVNHTVANCVNAETLEVVAGDCDSYGYTIYQCPVCDEVFADNFVKPEGNHNYELVKDEVPATCVEDGATAVYECTICGGTKGGLKIPAAISGHKWEQVGEPIVGDNGCTVNYKCSVCGETKAEEGAHDWTDMPVILVEPGYYTEGKAQYTCQVCGQTKEVPIEAEHDCAIAEEVEAADPKCEEDGNIYYWICECGKYYNAEGAEVTAEEVVIPKLGHNYDPEKGATLIETLVSPTCTEAGSAKIACANCGVEKVCELAKLPHTYDPEATEYKAPTCLTWGYTLEVCEVCGYLNKAEAHEPLGHTYYECAEHGQKWNAKCEECADAKLSKEYNCVEPDCTTDGSRTWLCGRCDLGQWQGIEKTGHAEVTVEIAARCAHYGYKYTYCTNANCTADLVSELVTEDDTYDLKVNGEAVHLIGEVEIDVEGGYDPDNHTRDNTKSQIVNAPTCTEDGNEIYFCVDCSYYDPEMVIPATGHDMVEVEGTYTEPTCTTPGQYVMECANGCGEWEIVDDPEAPALGHDLCDPVVVKPTCSAGGYTYVICTKGRMCAMDSYREYDYTDPLGYENYYESIEEAEEIHNYDGEWTTLREGDCLTIGLYISDGACADCGKVLLAIVDGTGNGHVEPDWSEPVVMTNFETSGVVIMKLNPGQSFSVNGTVWTAPKAPTCTVDGNTGAYICASCGTYVASVVDPANGEHEIVIDVPAKEATCEEAGCTEGSHCANCDEVTVESEVLPKLGHNLTIITDSAEQSCTQFGYTHKECLWCDYEVIVDYAKETGHKMDNVVIEVATCEKDGLKTTTCSNGCGHSVEEVIEAAGHKNAAGEAIVNICTDKVTDRVCVNENCDYAESENVVPANHTDVVTEGEKTCSSYAYVLTYCTTCGREEMVEDEISGYGDHSWTFWFNDGWRETTPATYHEEGVMTRECWICGHSETKASPVLEGLGLVLDVDNAAYAGATIVDSSLVKVTVSVDANKVDAFSYVINVAYGDELTFVGADFEGSRFNTNTFYTLPANADGKIIIAASAADAKQDLNINAEEVLFNLYFRVNSADATEAYLWLTDASFYNTANEASVDWINTVAGIVEIDKFLDIDNDGEFTGLDCQMAYQVLVGASETVYDATIDVDKDGEITGIDVQMLYNYLVSNLDYEDLTAAGL